MTLSSPITIHLNTFFPLIMAFVSSNNAHSGQISQDTLLSQLCVLSACNLSRKVGSPAPGPGQTSGQLQQSTVTSGPRLISQQTSPKSLRWELMSALLARMQILPISSNCCGSATFCALTRQTFGPNSAVSACKYESWQATDQWG